MEIFCVKNQFSFSLRSRHVKTSLKLFSRYYLYASTVHILLCYSIFVEYSIALCHFSVFPVLYRFQLGLGSNPVPLHVLLPSVAISPQLTECCFSFQTYLIFPFSLEALLCLYRPWACMISACIGPGPVWYQHNNGLIVYNTCPRPITGHSWSGGPTRQDNICSRTQQILIQFRSNYMPT